MKLSLKAVSAATLALIASALFPLAAAAQDKGLVVNLIPQLTDEFQTESKSAMESLIRSAGYEVMSMNAQQRADHQLNQLDDALLLDPKAIVIAAVDFDSVIPGIEEARKAGVKVIAYDRTITSAKLDLTSVVGTYEIGVLAAEETQRLLAKRYGSVKGKVLQISGDPGDNFTVGIQSGFDDTMAGFDDVTIITKPAMQWESSNAADIAENQLLANPDIDLIFSHAGQLAGAISSVLESNGKAPGEILQVTDGGLPQGLDLVRSGWVEADIEQPIYAQIAGIAMFLDMLIAGEEPKEGTYDILGLQAKMTYEDWGWNLVFPGRIARIDNVDASDFWGNLNPPTDPIEPIR
jgi:ribose transport system substrate-binding protein